MSSNRVLYGHVDEVAALVAFVAGPEASYLTGVSQVGPLPGKAYGVAVSPHRNAVGFWELPCMACQQASRSFHRRRLIHKRPQEIGRLAFARRKVFPRRAANQIHGSMDFAGGFNQA